MPSRTGSPASMPAPTTTSRSRSPSPSCSPACGRWPGGAVARGGGDRAVRQGGRAPRGLHAPARSGALALRSARARLGLQLRAPLERRRRLRPLPPREDRPAVLPPFARDGPWRRVPALRGGRAGARLPIRARLTLAFAAAMAAVLTATGAFVYLRLGRSLDEALNQGLSARADDVAALARHA